MIPTKPSDDIVDFLAFLEKAVGPEALRYRAGASLSEISQFVELARLPLPPLYLGFLREFGEKDGPLKMADDADSRVKTLCEFYIEQARQLHADIPPNGVAIGVYGLSGDRDLLYSEQSDQDSPSYGVSEEPRVVVSWGSDVSHTYALTFRNHLYRQAFIRGRFLGGALFSLRRDDEALLPKAKQLAIELGFEAYWFADDYQVCLEREEGSALYIVRIPDRTSLYGRFADQKTRDHLKALFIQQLGLQDSTPG